MFYKTVLTTDDYIEYYLGDVCNFSYNNLSLANSVDISSLGVIADIATAFPNMANSLDQNRFPFSKVFIKSTAPGSPANIQIWGW